MSRNNPMSFRPSTLTREQLEALSDRLGMSTAQVIALAVDRLYQKELTMKHTVLLEDGTVGTIDTFSDAKIVGEKWTVDLHDGNGNPIMKKGRIVEVLESE